MSKDDWGRFEFCMLVFLLGMILAGIGRIANSVEKIEQVAAQHQKAEATK